MDFYVEYRMVLNDASVFSWSKWEDLGDFASFQEAFSAIEQDWEKDGPGKLVDVSYDKIGIYQFMFYPNWQFRIVKKEKEKEVPKEFLEFAEKLASRFEK